MIVGIDLAASEKRNTGFCAMNTLLECRTKILHTDNEIVSAAVKTNAQVVSIDAPLSIPKGRTNIEDRNGPHFRECGKALLKMKIRTLPVTLGQMRRLTVRGMELKRTFETYKMRVIECHPGAAQDLLGIPRKQKGVERLRRGLMRFNIKGDIHKQDITHDELDAITSALVGKFYLDNKYVAIGDEQEGVIILPSL